jgi:hypothetical protein
MRTNGYKSEHPVTSLGGALVPCQSTKKLVGHNTTQILKHKMKITGRDYDYKNPCK